MAKKAKVKVNPLQEYFKQNPDMTRDKFAQQLDLSTPFVIDLVNGKNTNIRVVNLKKIHEVTGIDYQVLVEWMVSQVEAA